MSMIGRYATPYDWHGLLFRVASLVTCRGPRALEGDADHCASRR